MRTMSKKKMNSTNYLVCVGPKQKSLFPFSTHIFLSHLLKFFCKVVSLGRKRAYTGCNYLIASRTWDSLEGLPSKNHLSLFIMCILFLD